MMFQRFKKIIAIALTGIFLMSSVGVSLLLHYCLDCETKEYHLAGYNNSIKHEHENFDACSELTCCCEEKSAVVHQCGLFDIDSDCCETEVKYIVNSYESIQPNNSVSYIQLFLVPIKNTECHIYCTECSENKFLIDYIDPPPKLVAKAFVIFTKHFKYC